MKTLFRIFREWEHRYALTFVGCVLAIIFGVLALIPLFENKNPKLRMEVVSSANLVDVRDEIASLEIRFNNMNLRETHQSLALVTLRISNDGGGPITKNLYDDTAPLGVELTKGEIMQAQVIGCSSEYLSNTASFVGFLPGSLPIDLSASSTNISADKTSSRATLKPMILEAGDFVLTKLLILHPEKSAFELKPIGKVAGIKTITFIGINEREKPPSFWNRTFSGPLLTQLVRIVVYGGLVFSIAAIGFGVASFMQDANLRSVRRQGIKDFLETNPTVPTEFEWVLEFCVEEGAWGLNELNEHIENPKRQFNSTLKSFIGDTSFFYTMFSERPRAARKLLKLIKKSDAINEKAVVNESFRKLVTDLTKFFEWKVKSRPLFDVRLPRL